MSFLRKFADITAGPIPSCSAVIVAAGSSTRMGFDKLMADLCGKPVIYYTIKAFEECEYISEIVIVTNTEKLETISDFCASNNFSKVSKVVIGGKCRSESSLIGVCEISAKSELVAIHDGARPLVTPELISEAIRLTVRNKAVAPGIKSKDTIKMIDKNSLVSANVDRSKCMSIQTPQVFVSDIVKSALTYAVENNKEITDDCSAVQLLGVIPYIFDGDENNIKITTPVDLTIAEDILKMRE